MRTVFADTFFFIALLDTREATHARANEALRDPDLRLVTTEWVLAEFGNAYSDPKDRADFLALYRVLTRHPRVRIIAAATDTFNSGVNFFEQRPDKAWSLVDCISFVVMQEERLAEALTGDRHFEQAGFVALLKI